MTDNTPKPLLEKPEPPQSNECCGSGSCCPCVWDYYYEQLALWQQQQKQVQAEAAGEPPVSPTN